ncbi:MAG: FHA domain-containing protein [Acidobacteriota bacterium]
MSAKNFFEKLRKWIDGEEDLDEQGEAKPRSKWDDFLVAIAREVEAVMQREMFTPPGGPTYIPREYLVFLNPEDDDEWQGDKREGLQRGLHYVLSERAKALAGDNEFQTKSFAIELKTDASLERTRFRVQPVWDTETEKTMVQPRKKREAQGKVTTQETTAPSTLPAEEENKTAPFVFDTHTEDDEKTIVRPRKVEDDEATIVRPRKPTAPVFSLSVKRNAEGAENSASVEQAFYKDEITIGRGSAKSHIEVDLKLAEDMEVSRVHAKLKKTGDEFALTCTGANPIVLDGGRELAKDETAQLKTGDKFSLCSYEIVIQ